MRVVRGGQAGTTTKCHLELGVMRILPQNLASWWSPRVCCSGSGHDFCLFHACKSIDYGSIKVFKIAQECNSLRATAAASLAGVPTNAYDRTRLGFSLNRKRDVLREGVRLVEGHDSRAAATIWRELYEKKGRNWINYEESLESKSQLLKELIAE